MNQRINQDPPTVGISPGEISTPAVASLSLREPDRAALRPLVAEIESELATLRAQPDAQGYAEASGRLIEHWHRLVKLLALGTPPELRTCPHCGYAIYATATRCIQCWKKSIAFTPALGT